MNYRKRKLSGEVVEMTQDEIDEKIAREQANDLKYNDYRVLRLERYKRELDPFMTEAVADFLLENNSDKLDALKLIRAQIKLDIPKV